MKMTVSDWDKIQHFHSGENWGDWTMMEFRFVKLLDTVRHLADTPFTLSSPAWTKKTGHSSKSFHYIGRAADFRLDKLPMWPAYDLLVDTMTSMGVYGKVGFGFYPHGSPAFFHLDDRAMYPDVHFKPGVVWVRPDESKPSDYLYAENALKYIEALRNHG